MKANLFLCAALSACTTPNPLDCSDGSCTDPAFPYCDADGSLGGTPKICIAVDCTPGEVAQCQGSEALTCNSLGGDYDLVQCEHGCDITVGGCRLCEPNQTACTNGKVATCDARGNITASETCALGCFESEPRCREIDPSNNLGRFLDMVANPPDLDLTLGGSIQTTSGEVRSGSTTVMQPTFLIPPTATSPGIRVLVVGSVRFGGAVMITDEVGGGEGPALAIVARGSIEVLPNATVHARAGSVLLPDCLGKKGMYSEGRLFSSVYQYATVRSGGGGNATVGGAGGQMFDPDNLPGAPGGGIAGTRSLVPLQGGCAAGGSVDNNDGTYSSDHGPLGGGALQLSSRLGIVISGAIDAVGSPGTAYANGGAGAGGGLLLEAPRVHLGPQAKLLTNGGDGDGCSPMSANCGGPGLGATNDRAAGAGGPAQYSSPTPTSFSTGGGGGGLGRIRINTPTMTYEKANTTVEVGDLTTGALSTR